MTERSERMSEEAAYRLFLSGTLPLGYSILILFFSIAWRGYMTIKEFDIAEHLRNENEMLMYLREIIDDGDAELGVRLEKGK